VHVKTVTTRMQLEHPQPCKPAILPPTPQEIEKLRPALSRLSYVQHFRKCEEKSGDMFDMSRQQQLIDHEKDDQRRYSIIGESFPCLGEGEIQKTLGMPQEGRVGERALTLLRRWSCAAP